MPLLVSEYRHELPMSFVHFMQVYSDAWVARREIDVLVEEHRSIAMRVERKYSFVKSFSVTE